MSTLYLHIGTQKTGTTSLQFFLSENESVLCKFGFTYPLLDYEFPNVNRTRNAHFLIADYYNQKGKHAKASKEDLFEEGLSLVIRQLNTQNVILSDESIWYCSSYFPSFWSQLKEQIDKAGHTLKLIVYLRRQDLFVQSYWSHKVRIKETLSFPEYINREKYKFCRLDYYEHLEEISAIIGKENIMVRVFEKSQFEGSDGSIYADFLHTLGIEYNNDFFINSKERNMGIDAICTELKRMLNSNEDFTDIQSVVTKHLHNVTEKNNEESKFRVPSLFTPSLYKTFMDKFIEGNRKIAIEYLNRPDGILFTDPVQTISDESALQFDVQDYVAICGNLIQSINKTTEELEEQNALYRKRIDQLENRFSNRLLHMLKDIFTGKHNIFIYHLNSY